MKKLLYFFPVVCGYILYTFLGIISSSSSINPFVWLALIFLLISGILMNKNKWWGCIFGIAIGLLLIYMGTQETGQIIKETPFGIIMCIYYIVCAIISYRISNKNN